MITGVYSLRPLRTAPKACHFFPGDFKTPAAGTGRLLVQMTGAYLKFQVRGHEMGVCGRKSPSGVQGHSPGRRSEGCEAEASLCMKA